MAVNLDTLKATKDQLATNVFAALRENDEEKIKASMNAWMDAGLEEIKAVHREWEEAHDEAVLESRGIRALTTEETKFWNAVIEKARNESPEGVYEGLMNFLPETEYVSIIEELRREHPLLAAIDFRYTGPVIKWITDDSVDERASWHALNTAITKKLEGGPFKEMSMIFCKLTAYMPISNDMLDLGPKWVRPYALEKLRQAIAFGVEYGAISGSGVEEPIGMIRDFNQPFDKSTGYPVKEKIKVTRLDIDTYATIFANLSVKDNGKVRNDIRFLTIIVNPLDEISKIFPATTNMTVDNKFVTNIFPKPTQVITSCAVPVNDAVFGIAHDYFMAVSSNKGKGGEIVSDLGLSRFLEDQTLLKTKMYGNGMPLNASAFIYADISNLERALPVIGTTDAPTPSSLASKITIAGVTLELPFDRYRNSYTGSVSAGSGAINVTAKDGDATIEIKAGSTTVQNGGNVTFQAGKTTKVVVTVTNDINESKYTFNITRPE